jgi:hypothetical protein
LNEYKCKLLYRKSCTENIHIIVWICSGELKASLSNWQVLGNKWGRGDFSWWLRKFVTQSRQRSMIYEFWWLHNSLMATQLQWLQDGCKKLRIFSNAPRFIIQPRDSHRIDQAMAWGEVMGVPNAMFYSPQNSWQE